MREQELVKRHIFIHSVDYEPGEGWVYDVNFVVGNQVFKITQGNKDHADFMATAFSDALQKVLEENK